MAARKGLGKGLSALIVENTITESNESVKGSVVNLNINSVEPNKNQPRRKFNEDALDELSDSIKQYGIIQPLIVKRNKDFKDHYEIIAGERRWRAAKIVGLKEVPVVIKDYNSQEILEVSLIENIQREDLNPIEEALAFKRLLEEFNLKHDDIAEKVSKSRSAITNSLRLLNLDTKVQEMLIDEMISSGHARTLLSIDNKKEQYNLALRVFDEKLSVRETEKIVRQLLNPVKKATVKKEKSPIFKELENMISNSLGTKVTIKNKNNKKGRIEIEYYSQEELERITEILNGEY